MNKKINKNNIISIQGFIDKKKSQQLDFAITKSQTLLEILLIEIMQKRMIQQQLDDQITQLDKTNNEIKNIINNKEIKAKDREQISNILHNENIQAISYINELNEDPKNCLFDNTCSDDILKIKLQELCLNISDFKNIYEKNKKVISEQLDRIKEHLPIHLAETRSLLLKAKDDENFPKKRYEEQKGIFKKLVEEFDVNFN